MDLSSHWDAVYRAKHATDLTWYQPRPELSLALVGSVAAPVDAIVDVGAGASTLVDHLVRAGHDDVTLVDLSAAALDVIRGRLDPAAGVTFQVADVCSWAPSRTYDVWHDRAVFHFLTKESERADYRRALLAALRPGGHAMVSAFHLTGPDRCSGLPTAQYDAAGLWNALGGPAVFDLVHEQTDAHPHPRGGTQQFQVLLLRRRL